MKFIALIPVKNEARFLPTCLSSISNLVDQVICLDDGSTDNSKEIAKSFGCDVYDNSLLKESDWSEHRLRKTLLTLGRESKGTHFLCLDADEAVTSQFEKICKDVVLKALKPGLSVKMQWLALWKDQNYFRDDSSVWSNNFKDFIFADDDNISYDYAFLHIKRTPAVNDQFILDPKYGAILHYQFADWNLFNIKQADYRCVELIKDPNGADRINQTYSITFENTDVRYRPILDEWTTNIIKPDLKTEYVDWRLPRIFSFFEKYGVEFFEKLNIWHIQVLHDEFVKKTGREPSGLIR